MIGKDGMVTMLNELKRYALTKEITVSVKDSHGKPAEGAEVSFEVLNYSEYAPIAELKPTAGQSLSDNRTWKYPYFCKDVCRWRMAACRKQHGYKNRGLL